MGVDPAFPGTAPAVLTLFGAFLRTDILEGSISGHFPRGPCDRSGSGPLVPRRADPGAALRRPGDCSGSCPPCFSLKEIRFQPAWRFPLRAASSAHFQLEFQGFRRDFPDRPCASDRQRLRFIGESDKQNRTELSTGSTLPVDNPAETRHWAPFSAILQLQAAVRKPPASRVEPGTTAEG